MMKIKPIPMLNWEEMLLLSKSQQDSHLRRAYWWLWNDNDHLFKMKMQIRQHAPMWLWWISLAYVEGNINELEGTQDMSFYREILRVQLTK